MVFSTSIFLFAFLPAVIISYYGQQRLSPKKLRNFVLLFFSYVFYLYGAAGFLLILILSTLADYVLGLLVEVDGIDLTGGRAVATDQDVRRVLGGRRDGDECRPENDGGNTDR